MELNVKNLTATAITVAVAAIVFSAVFVPAISEAQKVSGEEVTYTNPLNNLNTYHYGYLDEVTLIASDLVSGRSYSTYTVNGQNIPIINDYMLALLTDSVSIQIGNSGQFAINIATDPYTATVDPSGEPTLTFTAKNGTWELVGANSGLIYSGNYSWVVSFTEDGEYIARNGNPANFYNSGNPADFILYSGMYTTGDLDTFYAYGKGELSCGVAEYNGTINFNNNVKVDGTTDVYRVGSVNVTISDGTDSETFTPYRTLVKETIIGHKDSGANYSLIGIIPLLVLAGLVIGVVGSFIRNRD